MLLIFLHAPFHSHAAGSPQSKFVFRGIHLAKAPIQSGFLHR